MNVVFVIVAHRRIENHKERDIKRRRLICVLFASFPVLFLFVNG